MRLVADVVKGMPVEKALNVLNFTSKIAAHHIAKTLKSAAANALSLEGTDHLKPEDLVVSNIIVDAAPTHKRIRFQSMGRIYRYKKRFCHLTVLLEGEMEAPEVKKSAGRSRKKKDETPEETAAEKTQDTADTPSGKGRKKVSPQKGSVKKKETKKTSSKSSAGRKAGVKKTSTMQRRGDR